MFAYGLQEGGTFQDKRRSLPPTISAKLALIRFFEGKRSGKPPILPVAMCLSVGRCKFFASQLVHFKIERWDHFSWWMTDGELALINGFKTYTVFQVYILRKIVIVIILY